MSIKDKALIYAVDDSDIDRILYESILGKDYNIQTFPSYEECLHAIAIQKPQVILCDLILPTMNGWEGVKAIKDIAPEIQLIVATCINNPVQHDTATIEGLRYWPKCDFISLKILIGACLNSEDDPL